MVVKQFQDGGRPPFWKSLCRHISVKIIRFSWNFVHSSRFRTEWTSRDQKWKFPKFNTADGRHFENRYIAISQWKSSDFHEILYTAADFVLDERHVIKNEKSCIGWLDRLRVRQNVFLFNEIFSVCTRLHVAFVFLIWSVSRNKWLSYEHFPMAGHFPINFQ